MKGGHGRFLIVAREGFARVCPQSAARQACSYGPGSGAERRGACVLASCGADGTVRMSRGVVAA
ncbi:hypothetical protein LC55x_3923 [Lysobacter capsici]|nr:hypothetical protein LC55x_3923 [Lysobacter capsici]